MHLSLSGLVIIVVEAASAVRQRTLDPTQWALDGKYDRLLTLAVVSAHLSAAGAAARTAVRVSATLGQALDACRAGEPLGPRGAVLSAFRR